MIKIILQNITLDGRFLDSFLIIVSLLFFFQFLENHFWKNGDHPIDPGV